ncbi:hypothetical protein AVEN_118228-1 [Araneus ventricosus]|uniref:Uncharacterized protein n=1 Tax=Araneus ventricosus TaxID=182803 RepID=A0A4Y2JN93_ARAVE|nr:hypothetical protein AVEN_118228-1 [Araneus ventricosus]
MTQWNKNKSLLTTRRHYEMKLHQALSTILEYTMKTLLLTLLKKPLLTKAPYPDPEHGRNFSLTSGRCLFSRGNNASLVHYVAER